MPEERENLGKGDFSNKPEQDELHSSSDSSTSLDTVAENYPAKEPLRKLPSKLESIPQQQEQTRGWLAKKLVQTLIGTVIGTFILIVADRVLVAMDKKTENESLREIITLIWTSETALIGTVLGFYFGSQNSDNS